MQNPDGSLKMERVERSWTRSTVTHFKGLTGGLSMVAMLHKILKDELPEVGGVSSAAMILPIVTIMGHDVLSWMHNFVNTTKHKETVWTVYGASMYPIERTLFYCSGGRYCRPKEKGAALLENQAGGAAVEFDDHRCSPV